MRNSINNQNNKIIYHEKISSRQFLIPNTYSSISNSKNKNIKTSHVTFEKNNSPKKPEKSNYKLSTIKNQKRNLGSKFNLVKTSLQVIQSNFNKETIYSQKNPNFPYKKNQTYFSNKTNNNSNASLSLQKSKKKDKTIIQEKNNKNIIKKRNKSNLENFVLSNRRNLKNYINSKIFYPPNNNLNNYKIYMKLNNINISSRNQKDSISQNQTNIKSLRKENKINRYSIDEDKINFQNFLSNLDYQRKYKSEISQKVINQLEQLMKNKKNSYYNKLNNNTMSSPNLNNEKTKKNNENHHHYLIIKKFNPKNINLNKNYKKGNEKNHKIFSPKK